MALFGKKKSDKTDETEVEAVTESSDAMGADDQDVDTKSKKKADKAAEKTSDEINDDQEMRIYEIGYLLLPTVGESGLAERLDTIKEVLASHGAQQISEGMPEHIDLAYEMEKTIENKKNIFETGFFGWIKFEAAPTVVDEIKRVIEGHPDVLRMILIKTVREDTFSQPIASLHSGRAKGPSAPLVDENPTNPSEVDVDAHDEEVDEIELDEKLDEIVE